jgi:hypothetical protein
VLEIYSEDRLRLARLGAGDDTGVSSFAARGTYALARDGSTLLLTRQGQSADTPARIVLEVEPGDGPEQDRLRLRVEGQEGRPIMVTKPRRTEAIPEALLPYLWGERHEFHFEADGVGRFDAVMRSSGPRRVCQVWNQASHRLGLYEVTIDGPSLRLTPSWFDATVVAGQWLAKHAIVVRESMGGVRIEWMPLHRPASGIEPTRPAQPTPTPEGLSTLCFSVQADSYQLRLSPGLHTADLYVQSRTVWRDGGPQLEQLWTATLRAAESGWELGNFVRIGASRAAPRITRVRLLDPTSALAFVDGSTQQILCQLVS